MLLLFLIYLPQPLSAQDFSNRGTDFWVGFQGHIDGAGSKFKLYLTSDVNTSGTISVPLQGWSVPFTVVANTITIVQVPSATAYVGCSDCTEQRGIHVVSNDNIAAYAHIYASARSDATLMLPTAALSKEYYAMCYTQATGGQRSEFLVLAVEDSTQVQITPKANTLGGNLANVPFVITLQQGEVYQVQSNTDLTGSKILSISSDSNSCKKVAVFSGSTFTTLGCGGTGDNLYEQMYPVNTWGKNFVTSPLKTRSGDMFRVMAGTNGTTVSINGVPHTLNQTQYLDTLLTVASYFTSDKPITLAQYSRTGGCDGATGDPFMIILSPLEQTINNVLLYSSPEQNITGEYINIVMKTADIGTCLLDGGAITFTPVPAKPDYSYSLNTVAAGTHTIVADSGFNAIAYGFGSPESYGYLAGTNIRNLEQQSFTVDPLFACTGSTVNFTGIASYVPDAWNWDFGDSTTSTVQSPTHIYADTGTYLVLLVTSYPNGCTVQLDTTSYLLSVYGATHAGFVAPDVCLGHPLAIVDQSVCDQGCTINSWQWDFGDSGNSLIQNPDHLYAACDTFNIKLVATSENGCKDSTIQQVKVNCLPTANFTFTPVCFNQQMVFADSSQGDIVSWNWDFGDGSPENTNNYPDYLYVNPGTYYVTLLVTTATGCKDSITKPVQVYYNPVADFSSVDICFGDTMYFSSTSTIDNSSSITGYNWLFGDNGPTGSLENPAHYYSAAGTYSVKLITTTIDGCADSSTFTVNAFDAPASGFIFNDNCLSDNAVFTNTSINPVMGSTASWSWDFGDGSTLNTIAWSPEHLYAAPGNYAVTLITHSSNLGCSDSLQDTITVFPMPVADFTSADVCLNQSMNFNDLSLVQGGSIAGRSWSFGDGSPLFTTPNPNHVYGAPATYIVKLTVTSNNGCIDSVSGSAVVHPLPLAGFSTENVCDGSSVPFTDLSEISSSDTIQSWTWNFGDGSALSGNQNEAHLYAANGSYTVQLLVVSNFGCSDSISKISIVNPNPTVLFVIDDTIGCEPLCVSFQNISSIATGTNVNWFWDYGDSSPGNNAEAPVYCYTNDFVDAAQFYTPVLTVTSDSGCVNALSKNNSITVYPKPIAAFNAQPESATMTNPVISIINLSAGSDFWNWDFGDSGASSVFNPPAHTYPDTGIYTITLITSTQYGCVDTAYETIVIEPDFLFYIPNSFTPNDDGINDFFTGKGIFITTFEMTIFDRWGNLIFFSDDINNTWDGKANRGTEIAQMDVYVYVIYVTDLKKIPHKYKGIVTLVR